VTWAFVLGPVQGQPHAIGSPLPHSGEHSSGAVVPVVIALRLWGGRFVAGPLDGLHECPERFAEGVGDASIGLGSRVLVEQGRARGCRGPSVS